MLPELSFDRWIAHFFDQPIANPSTSFPTDWWEGPSAEIVSCLTRTFEECETVLKPFSDAQVAQGLNFFLSGSGYMQELKETKIPLPDRVRCIETMAILFERCFALRLPPNLSHSEGSNPLHSVCWGWWDVLPLHGLAEKYEGGEKLDRAIMAVLRRILKIDSVACQESALYGLADWRAYYEEEASAIISNFLRRNPSILEHLHPNLAAYIVG